MPPGLPSAAKAGTSVPLPAFTGYVAYDGTVTAVRGTEGRTCVVIKNSVGRHDSFTGTLCCDAPVRSDEIYRLHDDPEDFVHPSGARDLVEMVVAELLSDRWFRVSYVAP